MKKRLRFEARYGEVEQHDEFVVTSTAFPKESALGFVFWHKKNKEWGFAFNKINDRPLSGEAVTELAETMRKLNGPQGRRK